MDSVRPSRDGHQFHEAWLARRSLGLLLAQDELCAIAVEGLSNDIQAKARRETIEIADATFFYGAQPDFDGASRIDVTQFKYSVARASVGLRFSDIKKTVVKFAGADTDFQEQYGAVQARSKLCYTLFTNRPVSIELGEALAAARTGRPRGPTGARSQYQQIIDAVPLAGDALAAFMSRFEIVGSADSLGAVERGTARTIADWSASNDVLARARLGELRDVVRKKAGLAGARDNLIRRVDVLAALGLRHEDDLFPTPDALPKVGDVVERVQLSNFIEKLGSQGRWLISAEGGIGKKPYSLRVWSKSSKRQTKWCCSIVSAAAHIDRQLTNGIGPSVASCISSTSWPAKGIVTRSCPDRRSRGK